MEKVYVFRVLIDYEKDVFRDIQIKSTQTFTEFHQAIQEAFDFDGEQMSSFYLSNESLWRERNTGLFHALLAKHTRFIFDESHLGIMKSYGILDLIKRYKLIPFLISILFVVGICIWRSSTNLIPPSQVASHLHTDQNSLDRFHHPLR